MSEPATPIRLHHLALGTADVAALAGFYKQFFCLPETARHVDEQGQLRSIWLDLGGSTLMIERTASPPRQVETVASGLFLIAFHVAKPERVRVEGLLEASGHRIENRTACTSYTRDPDGNRVAISHYPTL
jgi:glyoxylase I family protein